MVLFLERVLQTLFSFEDVDMSEGAVLGRERDCGVERGGLEWPEFAFPSGVRHVRELWGKRGVLKV